MVHVVQEKVWYKSAVQKCGTNNPIILRYLNQISLLETARQLPLKSNIFIFLAATFPDKSAGRGGKEGGRGVGFPQSRSRTRAFSQKNQKFLKIA